MAAQPPSPSTITPAQFMDLLALYPAALSAAYDGKIADGKKRAQALEGRRVAVWGIADGGHGKEGQGEVSAEGGAGEAGGVEDVSCFWSPPCHETD